MNECPVCGRSDPPTVHLATGPEARCQCSWFGPVEMTRSANPNRREVPMTDDHEDLGTPHSQGWRDGYGGCPFDARPWKGDQRKAYVLGYEEGQADDENGIDA